MPVPLGNIPHAWHAWQTKHISCVYADHAASRRAAERRSCLGEHETHQQRLKRDASRRLQRSNSSASGKRHSSDTGHLLAAIFVLVSVIASIYFVVLMFVREPKARTA